MTSAVTVETLQAFEGNEDLQKLKDSQARFNIFDAIGATHKELWHSDFLAFLLDPGQNHGLGDEFTKRLLRCAVPELSEIDSLEEVSVRREYRYVDILIQDEQRQVSIIIENKIWSPEASGQLGWYWETITGEHPGPNWRTFGVFLTPRGYKPTDARYNALSYSVVRDTLGEILDSKGNRLDPDVVLTIRHYIDMLGRSIVGNADVETMARRLYFKHHSAIKLMDPARWKRMIRSHLEHLIDEEAQVVKEDSNLEYVRFRVTAWDAAEGLRAGTGRSNSFPMLYFTFYNFEDFLTLYLWVGPAALPHMRAHLVELSERNTPPFCKSVKADKQYHDIYHLEFLTKNDYQTRSDEELKALIEARWQHFRETDLPGIVQTLGQAPWFRLPSEDEGREDAPGR